MDYRWRNLFCRDSIWLLLFSSFEASAKHGEHRKVMFHILSQKGKMSCCELSILHLAEHLHCRHRAEQQPPLSLYCLVVVFCL